MASDKVSTSERNGGYMARCNDCDAITFGGFPTRTAAREAIATEHDTEKKEAPGSRCTATEGQNPTALENEGSAPIMSHTDQQHEAALRDLSDFHIDVRHVVGHDEDWTCKGDHYDYRLFAITIISATKTIAGRIFCNTPSVKSQMLLMAQALRAGTYACDEESMLDDFRAIEEEGGTYRYRAVVVNRVAAITCDRYGCEERGETFAEGNHTCELALPESITDHGISVFYDPEPEKWLIDLNVAAGEYIDAEKAHRTAKALTEAAAICDRHNGVPLYRLVENAMAPEHDGIGGGL